MHVLGTIFFVTATASPPCFGSKMIFTLKLMRWTCKEPLMITQVVKIHQRTLNKHWGYVRTNPGIFGNAFFIPICDRSPGKQFPNNSVSVSGYLRELKQRAGRQWRQRERETSKGLGKQNNNLYVHHACSYIPLPSLHDYDLKVPYFAFCGGLKHKTTIFFFSSWISIDAVL